MIKIKYTPLISVFQGKGDRKYIESNIGKSYRATDCASA